jgi:hypothetical protein
MCDDKISKIEMLSGILKNNYNIYCICLKERDDRYESACNEFRKIGILDQVIFHRPERHIKGGVYGSFESTLWCLRDALKRDPNKLIMTFEDDIHFADGFINSIHALFEYNLTFFEDYNKWDTIRLGYWKGIFIEKIGKTPLYRGNCRAIHAIIWSPIFANKLLSNKQPIEHKGILDWYISKYSGRHYLLENSLCYQKPGLDSDIIWNIKVTQLNFQNNPIIFQSRYQQRTQWAWKWIGRWLPMKIRGYVQMLFVMDWEELIDMLLKEKSHYVFENKCIL